jgi:ketosteroid isomerase-like protein
MKFINAIVGMLALTCSCVALAQEQSPPATAEENAPPTVETAPTASATPTKAATRAMMEQGAPQEKAATATTKKEQPSPSPSAAPTMKKLSPQAAVKDAENRWAAAIGSHDRAAVESLVARDFIGVNLKGKIQNKRALLGEMKADKDKYSSSTNEKLEVNIYGPAVGVVAGTYHAGGTDKDGKAFDRTIRFTDTWLERDGQWQCIASQIMLVSPK